MQDNREDDHVRRGRSKTHRSAPSPRIQMLTDLFECRIAEQAGSSQQSSIKTSIEPSGPIESSERRMTPIQYGRLGAMDWQAKEGGSTRPAAPSRQQAKVTSLSNCRITTHLDPAPVQLAAPSLRRMEAKPAQPQGNISMVPPRHGSKYDGLPNSSGTRMPYFPSESDGSLERASESDNTIVDPPKESIDGSRGPSKEGHVEIRAVPAHEVFADDALPLHLPDLESFLSDTQAFPRPKFSVPSDICSQEEVSLYEWSLRPTLRKYEMCGDQIRVPRSTSETQLMRRRKSVKHKGLQNHGDRPDLDEESDVTSLSKTVSGVHCNKLDTSCERLKDADVSTKSEVFPPLMLLQNNSLDELKSNAIGPRKPPGGFIGSLPGCGSLLGTFVDFVVGVEGSTLAAGIFRLQMFIDFVQIMNLNLHFTADMRSISNDAWSIDRLLLRTVPAAVSLDFVSIFGAAVIVFYVLTGFVALLLFSFWRISCKYNPNRTIEGYASQPWLFRLRPQSDLKSSNKRDFQGRSTVWTKFRNISIVVVLTILYIPLSKLAVDALVWSSDYWPAQTDGSPSTAEMQGFCYRTSLNAQDFNWAYVILPISALVVIFYTLWFPFQMRKTIATLLPRVNRYNELGNKRTSGDLETEYMRLLSRDSSPLNFMYNAYRRRWGTYKPLYILCFKLSNLLVIGVFTNQNCLFHTIEVRKMLVIQQSILIGMQSALLAAHISIQPFVDMLSNRSEMVSRIGYVSTAVIGLLVALQIEGSSVYKSVLLYIVQALTYSGNIYFSIASTSWLSHLIKRKQNRLDFSIDIFSPALDLDKHIKRRIWQETLSIILLSGPEYRMPIGCMVTFSVNDEWPPYLLQYQGSAAERHIENLKILKAIGMARYTESVDRLAANNEDSHRLIDVIQRIQTDFAGVDAYWQPVTADNKERAMKGVTSHFGKAFMVPFPPTLILRYDQAADSAAPSTIQLTSLEQLEMFVWQNESSSIRRRRWVRQVLRALDGQTVYCPYMHFCKPSTGGTNLPSLFGSRDGKHYSMAKPVFYEEGTLRIKRNAIAKNDFGAGFEVFLTYNFGQRRDAEGISAIRRTVVIDAAAAFGLRDDFELTQSVNLFFKDNETLVSLRLPQVQSKIQEYRLSYYHEAKAKRKMMDYAFLSKIFDEPLTDREEMGRAFRTSNCSPLVKHLPYRYPAATTLLLERMSCVTRSKIHKWWFVFWDDLWRQNSGDFAALRDHQEVFNPQYSTSIAYTPISRAELQSLLQTKSGLWDESSQSSKKRRGLLSPGFLNRIYFTIDEIAFERTKLAHDRSDLRSGNPLVAGTMNQHGTIVQRSIATISIASGDTPVTPTHKIPMYADPFAAASRYTGGGTDQDNTSIVERYAWPWTEERLNGRPAQSRLGRWKGRLLEWLSVRPYKVHDDTSQLYIYLRTEKDRYVAAALPTELSS